MRWAILAILFGGLGLRLIVLWHTADLGTPIFDEQHYVQLAASLLHGDGLAWGPGRPTSLRPPLYPALVAGVWSVAGEGNLQAVRLVQIGLSLVTAVLTFELGRRTFNRQVGLGAAAVVWLYPTLVFLDYPILTETLFTLLLVAFVLLAVMLVQAPRASTAVACGIVLGLGALTRSVLWPLPIVLCPLLVLLLGGSLPVRRRLALPLLVLAGFALVVGPWAVRNTRLQGVLTIVDTMGGLNLRMGNYEHTPEDRMWDAVSLTGERNWVYALTVERRGATTEISEGEKDKWAQRKALEYMRAHPGTTLRRAAIKFGDFWGLERSFVAGVQQGLYHPPGWFAVAAAIAILVSSAAIMLAGAAGLWLARPAWRAHALLLLPIAALAGAHAIAFGHSRYHVPLVPLLAVYAAAFVTTGGWRRRGAARLAAAGTVVILIGLWARQILVVEGDRIQSLWSTWSG